ncbi:protein NRT1/ PTR FAMILY 5.5-like [Pistacia vera]|uniref:protein NRT1/ PTR FAMILY 5.5-like n=1 Tax=Pistacia vera TaxID=55513 RepID=UPI001262D5AB|nr:protein NRT1/ PTR FAMILY 5.5-like [Pistacia vera]
MIFISQEQLMGLLNSFNPVMLIYIFSKSMFTASYRILSRMGVAFVLVFVSLYNFIDYAVVALFITYFTDTTDYHIMKAAKLTNIQEGLSKCLKIIAVYISESRLGHIKVIFFSTICFTLGLGLLYKSTVKYSDLSVIIGILFLAVGKAGLEAPLKPFLCYQLKVDEPETNPDESQVSTQKSVWKRVWGLVIELSPAVVKLVKKDVESLVRSQKSVWKRVWIRAGMLVIMFSPAVVASVLTFFLEWQKILLIATSLMGSACFLFCRYICLYNPRELAGVGNCFSVIFRVIKALVLQIRILRYHTSSNHPVDNDNDNDEHQFQFLSFHMSQVQLKLVKKCFVSVIPMWTTILVVGLVLSTGDTFFPEQGKKMKSSEFLVSLFIIRYLSLGIGSYLLKLLISSKWIPEARKKTTIQAGICGGIVSSILCSAIGWQVEHRTATIIRINGLSNINFDYSDETISMSIFWLSPQFFLLGLTEGFITTGLNEFTVEQFQDPCKKYVSEINEFVIGLGNFLSILFIQANKSLFGDTLSNSQLDKYYCRLTIVSSINMLIFFFVIYLFYGSTGGMIRDAAQVERLEEGRETISSAPPMGGESTESNINTRGLIRSEMPFRRSLRRREGEVNDLI